MGESCKDGYDLNKENDVSGRNRDIRRSAVVATSSCDLVSSSVDSTETCRRLAVVGRVVTW